MKYFLISLTLTLFHCSVQGQNDTLPDAFVEYNRAEYAISKNHTSMLYKCRVQILKPGGAGYGSIVLPSDKSRRITSFKAVLTDKSGKKIKSLSKSDLAEVSEYDGFSLYSDNKLKTGELKYFDYPYTIEYEYELEYDDFAGRYYPFVNRYNTATRYSELVVKTTADLPITYRTNRFTGTIDSSTEGNINIRKWKCENIPAIPNEILSPSEQDLFPAIFILPKHISYAGSTGTWDDWESFGNWQWGLIKDRNDLSSETIAKVHALTDTISDLVDKIKILYKYLQSNTRYVSIQIGIGSWQPFPASLVDKNKYGDCKALSNYLRSLLNAADIESIYTVIGNGDDQKIKFSDFPAPGQLNHAVLIVPLEKDTIWLECTSNICPFGYFTEGNANRLALCVTPEGGKLVHTPVFGVQNNYQNTHATITLNKQGGIICAADYLKSGPLMEEYFFLKSYDKKTQEKYIYEGLPARNLLIKDFSIRETEEVFPKIRLDIQMEEGNFASKTGALYSFSPNYLNRFKNPLTSKKKRINDIYIPCGYQLNDTIHFILPDGLTQEYIPEAKTIQSTFGKIHAEYKLEGKELIFIRNFTHFGGTFDKTRYNELYEFYRNVERIDNQKIILKE